MITAVTAVNCQPLSRWRRTPAIPPNFGESFGSNAPVNYERYFVPVIGKPLAERLVRAAQLKPGERVLDVACGTGIVARLAARDVGDSGVVAGLDVNPGMLAVAKAALNDDSVEWFEAGMEAMPVPDGAFDVVTCQMGLQFVPDKDAARRRCTARSNRAAVWSSMFPVRSPRP